jgi:hypothetical protein
MKKLCLSVLVGIGLAGSVSAGILINESFTTDLSGETGLGAWTGNNINKNAYVWKDGETGWGGTPSFPGQPTVGGFIRRNNASGSAGVSSLIDGDVDLVTPGKIYFSALIRGYDGSASNHNAEFILGNTVLDNPGGAPGALMTAGAGKDGLGFGLNGNGTTIEVNAFMYDEGVGSISTGSFTTDNPITSLIVGEIIWGATDTLNLYNITDVNAPLPAAFATLTGTLDESSFNTLALADKRATGFDEIRFGTEVGDVIPEPATFGMLGMGALITMFIRRRLVK